MSAGLPLSGFYARGGIGPPGSVVEGAFAPIFLDVQRKVSWAHGSCLALGCLGEACLVNAPKAAGKSTRLDIRGFVRRCMGHAHIMVFPARKVRSANRQTGRAPAAMPFPRKAQAISLKYFAPESHVELDVRQLLSISYHIQGRTVD